jgi:hypothetical protein
MRLVAPSVHTFKANAEGPKAADDVADGKVTL